MAATVATQEVQGNSIMETIAAPVKNIEKKQANKDLQKTRLCVYNLEGKCGYGASCVFAHSPNEIRGVPDLKKTQLCQKFMEGNCSDENCSYAHGYEELRDPPNFKRKLCKWNSKGICRNGAKCGFAHSTKELRGVEPPPGFQPLAEQPQIAPPPGLEKMGSEADGDTSTEAPSTQVDTSASLGASPDAALFHFAGARGAAPLKKQVALMSSAVNALQAKLAMLEDMVVQTQVTQMQAQIQQLSEQCWALENGLGPAEEPVSAEPTKSRLSAKATPFVPFMGMEVSDDSTSVGSD